MTKERKRIIAVSEEEQGLLCELAILKEQQVMLAGNIKQFLEIARVMDRHTSPQARKEVHDRLNELNTESHTINVRCNEIYKRLQLLTKNKTAG